MKHSPKKGVESKTREDDSNKEMRSLSRFSVLATVREEGEIEDTDELEQSVLDDDGEELTETVLDLVKTTKNRGRNSTRKPVMSKKDIILQGQPKQNKASSRRH